MKKSSFYIQKFGWVLFEVVALFLMLPMNLLLEFLVYLLKNRKLISLDNISSNEYRELRLRHDQMYQRLSSINQMVNILEKEIKNITFVFRWTLNICIKIRNILKAQYNENSKKFTSLSPKKKSHKGFERLTEEEIWNNRAKNYEYLI